jgi:hypothetical protein
VTPIVDTVVDGRGSVVTPIVDTIDPIVDVVDRS